MCTSVYARVHVHAQLAVRGMRELGLEAARDVVRKNPGVLQCDPRAIAQSKPSDIVRAEPPMRFITRERPNAPPSARERDPPQPRAAWEAKHRAALATTKNISGWGVAKRREGVSVFSTGFLLASLALCARRRRPPECVWWQPPCRSGMLAIPDAALRRSLCWPLRTRHRDLSGRLPRGQPRMRIRDSCFSFSC